MRKFEMIKSVIIPALALTVLLTGCSKQGATKDAAASGDSKKGGKPGMRDAMRGPRIETTAAVFKPIVLEKQYVGAITPFLTVDVKSTASGWLRNITVDTGDTVLKNSVIGVIENDDIQAQVEQSQAGILVSKAAVTRAEVDLERIKLESNRSESLFAKGYISKQELEQAQASEKLAEAAVESAKAQLILSEAQLKNIKVKLRDSSVKAPFTGVVAQRYVDPGAYVSPSNPIVRIEDNSKVEALINVVENDFSHIRKGASTDILIDSYPDQKFSGRIFRISPSMDKASRTAAVEILIPNGGGKLKSGMTARANIVLSRNPNALIVPESAVRRDVEQDFSYVFVVEKGIAHERKIETGIVSGGEVEITGGLKPGEVVVNGDVRMSDGMKIEASRGKGGRK
jgi:RND family efflux transporter MFP subunit